MVGSTYPGGEEAPKGSAVRRLKSYASWVQTVDALIAHAMLIYEFMRMIRMDWRMSGLNPRKRHHSRRLYAGMHTEKLTYIGRIPLTAGQYRGNSLSKKPVETECEPSRTDGVTVQCTQ